MNNSKKGLIRKGCLCEYILIYFAKRFIEKHVTKIIDRILIVFFFIRVASLKKIKIKFYS